MKNLLKIGLVAVAATFGVGRATALPLGSIRTPDGEKVFSQFDVGGAFDGQEEAVTVEIIGNGTALDPWGLLFTGPFYLQGKKGDTLDFSLRYKVQTSGEQLISSIGQGVNASGIGIGNSLRIVENVWSQGFAAGDLLAASTLTLNDVVDPAAEGFQGDQLTLIPPDDEIWVTKDIRISLGEKAEGQQDDPSVDVSIIVQRFHQTGRQVPDGGTSLSLLGVGLLGIGFLRSRWGSRKY